VNAQAASARWLPWLQLARVTNLPTAWADVLAGYLLLGRPEQTNHWIAWALLLAASSALYTAGMVLNDVADVEEDRRRRPERPIPSGRISWRTARGVGWALLALGTGMAFLAGALQGAWRPGLVALVLAGLVVAYDFGLKRLWLGPLRTPDRCHAVSEGHEPTSCTECGKFPVPPLCKSPRRPYIWAVPSGTMDIKAPVISGPDPGAVPGGSTK